MARFEHERIHDFKDSLQAFLDGMILRQKEASPVLTVDKFEIQIIFVVDCCLGSLSADDIEKDRG